MSDTSKSGDSPTAPAEAPADLSASSKASAETLSPPPASFGNSRGSGLARGKRASQPAAAPASTASQGTYKPSSIQVITVETEYKNPFAPVGASPSADSEPVTPAQPAKAVAAPREEPTPEPAAVVKEAPPPPAATPPVHKPKSVTEPTFSHPEGVPPAPEEKAELNILPPADTKRPAQSWESSSFNGPRGEVKRENRPIFKPERRELRTASEIKEGGTRREPRSAEPKAAHSPAPKPVPVKAGKTPEKSGGLIGWLKSLFGGAGEAKETPARNHQPAGGGKRDDDDRQRRRRRGGRGRNPTGASDAQAGPGGGSRDRSPQAGGEGRSGGDGNRRRRRRGGRGRSNGPRREGGEGPAS